MARPEEVRGGVAQHEDWCSRLNDLLSDTSYLFSHVPTQLDKLLVDKVPSVVSHQVLRCPGDTPKAFQFNSRGNIVFAELETRGLTKNPA